MFLDGNNRYSAIFRENQEKKLKALEQENHSLKVKHENTMVEQNSLSDAFNKRKCQYPKCSGQGNINQRLKTHWSINNCVNYNEVISKRNNNSIK